MTQGGYLKSRREGRGLSLRKVAREAGVASSYLCRVEQDQAPPSVELLQKLAPILEEDPNVLLGVFGKISPQIQKIIAARPKQFAAMIEHLEGAPEEHLDEMVRQVLDGKW